MAKIEIDTTELEVVGDNLKYKQVDNILVLVIDTNQPGHLSNSGKMKLVAGASRWQSLTNGDKLSLNYGRKA